MSPLTKTLRIFIFLFLIWTVKSSYAQCSANFTYAIGANGSVTFASTSANTSSVTNYTWNFGPASFSATGLAGTTAAYTYTANGNYMVFLTIFSSVPTCSSSIAFTVNITNVTNTCVLNANFTFTQAANGVVNFNNTTTGTVVGTTYSWNYGDGVTSTSFSSPHTYTSNGTYTITLTANNNFSTSCVSTKILGTSIVSVCNINANFTSSQANNGWINFNNITTGSVVGTTFSWNYGDGATSSSISSPHTYTANGSYLVTLTANNNFSTSCVSTKTTIVVVTSVCSLSANFTYTLGNNGQVNFTSTSLGTTSLTAYVWSFGNGQGASGYNLISVSNTYTANGNYIVTLVDSTSSPSCLSQISQTITISNAGNPCNLNANFTSVLGSAGVVNFNNVTTGTVASTTYTWSFGDGTTSSAFAPSHTYSSSGGYVVSLTANNNGSITCSNLYANVVLVSICNLAANFSHTVGANGLVNFSSSSTGTTGAGSYNWNFGDGFAGSGISPSHAYLSGGSHNVSLIVNDTTLFGFCHDTIIQSINITTLPCSANSNFSLNPTNTPQYWTATPSYPWNVTNAVWNWGDGSSSIGLYSSHNYSVAATYTVCLTVTVSCGSTASTCVSQYISKSANGESMNMISINVVAPALIPTGINNLETTELEFKISPNPSNGVFTLGMSPLYSATAKISIYNLIGKLMYETIAETPDASLTKQINAYELSNGVYFIRISANNNEFVKKMIINK